MRLVEPNTIVDDERGMLKEVVNKGNWKQMNHLTIKKGKVRGNHYHKKLAEVFYIVSGKVEFKVHKMPDGDEKSFMLSAGECVIVEPNEHHTLTAIEDVAITSLYSEVFDPNDIYN